MELMKVVVWVVGVAVSSAIFFSSATYSNKTPPSMPSFLRMTSAEPRVIVLRTLRTASQPGIVTEILGKFEEVQ